jgi:hypothetical protein
LLFCRNLVIVLPDALDKANKHADDLALKLAQSEKAREKAKRDAAPVESFRKRLHDAETALSDNITRQIAREEDIAARLESQNRRFISKFSSHFIEFQRRLSLFCILAGNPRFVSAGRTSRYFELEKPEDGRLLDALSHLEIHGDEVRRGITDAKTVFSRLFFLLLPDEGTTQHLCCLCGALYFR